MIDDIMGVVLDTRSMSGFHGGSYLVWNIAGGVTFKVTNTSPSNTNAVISGLFLGGASSLSSQASFVKQDLATQGNWKSMYGVDGYNISQDLSASNPQIPSYASVSLSNTFNYLWNADTTDSRALRKPAPAATTGIAGTWFSDSGFSIDVKLNDGKTHEIALYTVDWDSTSRTETVQVIDDVSGTVLDARTLSSFHNGAYLVWNISGSVTFTITNSGNSNAVLSGLFFGGAPVAFGQAAFVQQEILTQGTWKGGYGADGFDINQDPSANNPSLPSYAAVAVENSRSIVWNPCTTNVRALQKSAVRSTDRMAATWFSNDSFDLRVNLNDG